MRQDIQAVLRMLGDRNHYQNGQHQDGSQLWVNENEGRRDEERGRRGEGNQKGQSNWRKWVELLVFEGGDPLNRISRVEKFFELQLAFINMEGYAGYWFRFWREKTKNSSWEGLKRAMVIRFGGGTRGSV